MIPTKINWKDKAEVSEYHRKWWKRYRKLKPRKPKGIYIPHYCKACHNKLTTKEIEKKLLCSRCIRILRRAIR